MHYVQNQSTEKGGDCTPLNDNSIVVRYSSANYLDLCRFSMRDHNKQVQFLRILESQQGQRIDNFLIRYLKGVPRSRVYRLIRRGEVRINKKRCKPSQKILTNDEVRIPPFSGATTTQPVKPGSVMERLLENSVLFENDEMLVINKPAGIAVHGGSSIRLGLIEALRQIKPQWSDLELAHRLDRDTSGCLIVSKNSLFLRYIHNKFKVKSVHKEYLALVHGRWPQGLSEIEAPLLKNHLSSKERIVTVRAGGRSSLTRFEVVRRFKESTLIKALPVSGRKHQIRAHCKHAGHPIVGDRKYGLKAFNRSFVNIKTLCLHASKIKFLPQGESEFTEVEAPTDKTMAKVISDLN